MTVTAPPRTGRAPSGLAGSPLPTRERRPGYVALAVVLIVGLAAVGASLYASAGAKSPVLMVVRQIPVGQQIQRADLTTVSLAGNIDALGEGRVAEVVGRSAAVTLMPGTILRGNMIGDQRKLDGQTAQVGLALKPGQLPADSVSAGDYVQVFKLLTDDSSRQASSDADSVALTRAVVVSAVRDNPSETGGTLLTVDVPLNVAGDVAAANGSGHISVVRVAGS